MPNALMPHTVNPQHDGEQGKLRIVNNSCRTFADDGPRIPS
jgi:hypothetical protein